MGRVCRAQVRECPLDSLRRLLLCFLLFTYYCSDANKCMLYNLSIFISFNNVGFNNATYQGKFELLFLLPQNNLTLWQSLTWKPHSDTTICYIFMNFQKMNGLCYFRTWNAAYGVFIKDVVILSPLNTIFFMCAWEGFFILSSLTPHSSSNAYFLKYKTYFLFKVSFAAYLFWWKISNYLLHTAFYPCGSYVFFSAW